MRDLLTLAALALPDPRPRRKFVQLGLGLLCGQKPKTITSALEWLDQRQQDWSADHRLFSQAHWDSQQAFAPVFTHALHHSSCGTQRVYFGQDDTLRRKASRKIPGTHYARDPLSPPFQVNLVLGQRFVQTSLSLRPGGPEHPWRALPVSFAHAPPPKIPKRASPEEQAALQELRKKHRLSLVALAQIQSCRRYSAKAQAPAQIAGTPFDTGVPVTKRSIENSGESRSSQAQSSSHCAPQASRPLPTFGRDARPSATMMPEKALAAVSGSSLTASGHVFACRNAARWR